MRVRRIFYFDAVTGLALCACVRACWFYVNIKKSRNVPTTPPSAPQATPRPFVLSKEKIPNFQICSLHSQWHWNSSEAAVSFLMRTGLLPEEEADGVGNRQFKATVQALSHGDRHCRDWLGLHFQYSVTREEKIPREKKTLNTTMLDGKLLWVVTFLLWVALGTSSTVTLSVS